MRCKPPWQKALIKTIQVFAVSVLCLSASGCYYLFQVPSKVNPATIGQVKKSNRMISLVMDQPYREYVSFDRGHPLADPQRYEIGPGLAELTESYFRAAFENIAIIESPQGRSQVTDVLVIPQVESFKNDLTIIPTEQALTLSLIATVLNENQLTIGKAQAMSSSKHPVKFLRDSEERISAILSDIIQRALVKLVADVEEVIASANTP